MSTSQLLVLAPHPLRRVPGQRFRFEQYLDVWADAGIEPTVRTFLDGASMDRLYAHGHLGGKVVDVARGLGRRLADLASLRRFDAAFVFREALPVGPALVERVMPRLGVPYIYDFDDAIYLPNSSDANRFVSPLKFPNKVASLVKGAALVTAGSPHLAGWARQHQSNVRVLPTTIDTDLYVPAEVPAGRPLCVGWSGSITTVQHLRGIEAVLREIQAERSVRIRVIGDAGYSLPGADVEAMSWRESTELDDLREIDVGVMPLPDDDWSRGKCGLKALQYMALGIPTVMSPVGVNLEIAEGGAARLASTHDEWRSTLLELIDDREQRRSLGAAGRQRVIERYSVSAMAPRYIDAVRSVIDR